eukprot:CAMPEP_0172872230 /NCGR_PEP_ID=MMETSP1075-20121228/92522_1 /TAXON_ID=2916 /ORGANISM="Ceratium fusus, Strain PA161109" /LENGTH=161 /DNA_ID=CAMNT_0013722543 /DNA_START=23 /DNA_END=505 /DNA_ORIENTATION=-
MSRLLFAALAVAGSLAASEAALTAQDCEKIPVPTDESSGLPLFSVRFSDTETGTCTVECDAKPKPDSKLVIGCTAFADGVIAAMGKADLSPDKYCQKTELEYPGKKAGETDPEMVVQSCPEWFLYMGWDRNLNRTLGNMRQEVVLKTPSAVDAFKKILPSP